MEFPIENYDKYNSGMVKSMIDKIFFINKIEVDTIIDYGCANGSLISFLSSMFPEINFIGYDIDPHMVDLASNKNPDSFFSSNWDTIECKITDNTAVLLSSVLHEIYAYGLFTDIDIAWKRIFKSDFKYIIIRDMIPSNTIDRVSDINDYKNVIQKANPVHLSEFTRIYGSIENNKNLIHFLLKYRYTENWKREVSENYFPFYKEDLIYNIPENYKITFFNHEILPFFKDIVYKDFNIVLHDFTHLKLILEKID